MAARQPFLLLLLIAIIIIKIGIGESNNIISMATVNGGMTIIKSNSKQLQQHTTNVTANAYNSNHHRQSNSR